MSRYDNHIYTIISMIDDDDDDDENINTSKTFIECLVGAWPVLSTVLNKVNINLFNASKTLVVRIKFLSLYNSIS